MTADTTGLMSGGASLAFADDWAAVFVAAGRELADLAATGQLRRGLRAVLAHHIIFAWNRHGLPYATQTALASTAKLAVFGPDPAAERAREEIDP
jgi:thiopeptide-type bacteriocin biosynthesis protein